MDFSKLRSGEKIASVSAILLFILAFFKWYDLPGDGRNVLGFDYPDALSAWQIYSFWDLILLLVVILVLLTAVLTATSRSVALPVSANVITFAVSVFLVLGLIIRLFIDKPGPGEIHLGLKIWAYLGLLAAIGVVYGSWKAMSEEGTSIGDIKDKVQDSVSSVSSGTSGSAEPPPPPAEPTPPSQDPPSPPAA